MNIWYQLKQSFLRWMDGRHGIDQLGTLTLFSGLLLSLTGAFTGTGIASFLGLALYIVTVYRMLSRNKEARQRENRKYIELTEKWSLKVRQFFRRLKNRKEYKYFKCPRCKQLLRLKRGCGPKSITCAKCGHQFSMKA